MILTNCFLGMGNFVIPVCFNGDIVAYCLGGGVVLDEVALSEKAIKNYHITKLSKAQFEELARMVQSILCLLDVNLEKAFNKTMLENAKGEKDPFGGKLSRREYEVAEAICQGMTNKEVSKKLYISEKTVKSHVSNILLKLDLKDRVHLVLRYSNYFLSSLGEYDEH